MADLRRRMHSPVIAICLLEAAITGSDGPATFIALSFALTAVPVAIGIAVLRYRLYEIDRLINLTLVYLVLTVAPGRGVRGSGDSGRDCARPRLDRSRLPRRRSRWGGCLPPRAAIARAGRWSIAGSTRRATRGCGAWTRFLQRCDSRRAGL